MATCPARWQGACKPLKLIAKISESRKRMDAHNKDEGKNKVLQSIWMLQVVQYFLFIETYSSWFCVRTKKKCKSFGPMLGSDICLYFDGRGVCEGFFSKTFKCSRALQCWIKNGPRLPGKWESLDRYKGLSEERSSEKSCIFYRRAAASASLVPDMYEKQTKLFLKRKPTKIFWSEFWMLFSGIPPKMSCFPSLQLEESHNLKAQNCNRFSMCSTCHELARSLKRFVSEEKCNELLLKMNPDHKMHARCDYKEKF